MRVITEERLKEIKESMPDGMSKLFVHGLIIQCQEIDQLTVSKLRPMSEAPRDGAEFLLYSNYLNSVHCSKFKFNKKENRFTGADNIFCNVREQDMIGYIPMPEYIPEQP